MEKVYRGVQPLIVEIGEGEVLSKPILLDMEIGDSLIINSDGSRKQYFLTKKEEEKIVFASADTEKVEEIVYEKTESGWVYDETITTELGGSSIPKIIVNSFDELSTNELASLKVGESISVDGILWLVSYVMPNDVVSLCDIDLLFDAKVIDYRFYNFSSEEWETATAKVYNDIDNPNIPRVWVLETLLSLEEYSRDMKAGDILIDEANDRMATIYYIDFEDGDLVELYAYGFQENLPFKLSFDRVFSIEYLQVGTKLYKHEIADDGELNFITIISTRSTPYTLQDLSSIYALSNGVLKISIFDENMTAEFNAYELHVEDAYSFSYTPYGSNNGTSINTSFDNFSDEVEPF